MFNERYYINDKWLFFKEWQDDILEGMTSDAVEVRIPHSVSELPFHYYDESFLYGTFGYRRTFHAPASWRSKRILLTFEGAAHRAELFINSSQAAEHTCGYTPFTVDITDHIRLDASNTIIIKLDTRRELDQPPFYRGLEDLTFGGLYRDVYIEARDPVCMKNIFIRPTLQEIPKTRGMSLKRLKEVTVTGRVTTDVILSDRGRKRAEEHRLFVCQFLDGRQISNQPLPPEGNTTTLAGKVHLWDTASPHMYELRTELRLDGDIVDTDITRIGFRTITWKPSGMLLNGRRLVIRGLNRRQVWPYVGLAMPASIQAEDARILKEELGCNAVRACDGSPSSHFLDACDERGLLVFCDCYGRAKDASDKWIEAAGESVRDMAAFHFNHPSVMLWGTGFNGITDPDVRSGMASSVKELDPSRLTAASTRGRMEDIPEDVYACEDYSGSFEEPLIQPKGAVAPDRRKPYIISEYAGFNSPARIGSGERALSSQMMYHAGILNAIASEENIAGGFGSDMCDHFAGRIMASDDGIRPEGVMDAFRNPKYAAKVYAASSGRGNVLFISSHLNRQQNPGRIYGNVYMVTNADSVSMYCDDVLIREYSSHDALFSSMRHGPIEIDAYTTGEDGRLDLNRREDRLLSKYLNERVRGADENSAFMGITRTVLNRIYKLSDEKLDGIYSRYFDDGGTKSFRFEAKREGRTVATVIREPSVIMKLEAELSSSSLIEEHTYDVIAIRVRVTDQNDNVLEDFDGALQVKVRGPVELTGEAFVIRGGMCGLYVRSLGEEADAMISLFAEGAGPLHIPISVQVKSSLQAEL